MKPICEWKSGPISAISYSQFNYQFPVWSYFRVTNRTLIGYLYILTVQFFFIPLSGLLYRWMGRMGCSHVMHWLLGENQDKTGNKICTRVNRNCSWTIAHQFGARTKVIRLRTTSKREKKMSNSGFVLLTDNLILSFSRIIKMSRNDTYNKSRVSMVLCSGEI